MGDNRTAGTSTSPRRVIAGFEARRTSVVFVDRVPPPLAFVGASLAANDCTATGLVVADVRDLVFRRRFDVVLAAEFLYDRLAFDAIASTFARLLTPGGCILMTDGH